MQLNPGMGRKTLFIYILAAGLLGTIACPTAAATTVYSNANASGFAFCGGGSIQDLGFVNVLPENAVTAFTFASAGSQFGGGVASFTIFSDPSHTNIIQAGSLGGLDFGFPGGGVTNFTVFVPGFLPSGYWQISLNSVCSPTVSTASYVGITIDQEPSPPSLVSLGQFAAGNGGIAQGGVTTSTTISLTASVQASTTTDPLQVQVEVQPSANGFTGNPTAVVSSSAGQTLTVSIPNLSVGSYHWAARVFDLLTHAASAWQPFSPSTIDFVIANALVQTSSTVLSDPVSTFSAGDGSVGGCCSNFVMPPSPMFYHAPAPFTIQSIVVDDADLSLNNHDGFGNIRAKLSDTAGNPIANSTNTVYGESGCSSCSFSFSGEAVPQDFQLSFVVEDGIQGDGFFKLQNMRLFVTSQTGTIIVAANNAAATFSITDDFGHLLSGMGTSFIQAASPGVYTIIYGNILGFTSPASATASLSAGGTITFDGIYNPLPPVLSVSTPTMDFERQIMGMQSSTQSVIIENSGGGVLTPIITISGDFSQTSSCSFDLSAGQTCQVSVSFSPSEPGTRNSILSISNLSPALTQQVELTGVGTLAFPLKGSTPGLDEGLTAATAEINSIFDHSMQNEKGQYSIYDCDKKVVDFMNEIGEAAPTDNVGARCEKGYSQANGNPFWVNGNYAGSGKPKILFYDGHPGYDYESGFGNQVYAATAGTIHYPTLEELQNVGITVGGDPDDFHVLELDAAPDLKLFYLHLSTHPRALSVHLEQSITSQDFIGSQDSRFSSTVEQHGGSPKGSLSFSGSVTINGLPAAKVPIHLAGITVQGSCVDEVVETDTQGQYEFKRLPEGFYNVRPVQKGFGFAPTAQQAIAAEGSHVAAGDLIAASGNAGPCLPPHLHFEVQRATPIEVTDHLNGRALRFIPVDPYGWQPAISGLSDPYLEIPDLTGIGFSNDMLWQVTKSNPQ